MAEIDDRAIEVEWETEFPKLTKRFSVTSRRTYDLFGEIEGALRKHKGHLIEGRLHDDEEGRLRGTFTMEGHQESKNHPKRHHHCRNQIEATPQEP
jgi:GTP pyrophosphokinase